MSRRREAKARRPARIAAPHAEKNAGGGTALGEKFSLFGKPATQDGVGSSVPLEERQEGGRVGEILQDRVRGVACEVGRAARSGGHGDAAHPPPAPGRAGAGGGGARRG